MRQTINTNNFSEVVSVIAPIYNVKDKTPNNSDKTWTVPANELWHFNSACVQLATSATAGNRVMAIYMMDPEGDAVKHLTCGITQAANTTVFYCFNQGTFRETAVVNSAVHSPVPWDFFIPGGYGLRFLDTAAIAPTADDMNVFFQVMRYVI
jgi:hypothetical protein